MDLWKTPNTTTENTHRFHRGGLYVFTTSTDFEAEKAVTKFTAYAIINFNGDKVAAYNELLLSGYGHHADSVAGEVYNVPPEVSPTSIHLFTDLRNSERLLKVIDGRLTYSERGWSHWNGKCWKQSKVDAPAWQYAKRLSHIVRKEMLEWQSSQRAKQMESEEREKFIAKYNNYSAKCEDSRTIEAAIKSLKRAVNESVHTFDTNPYLLNVLNGTIDLRTGKLLKHDRGKKITHLIEVAYDKRAKCPRWDRFISEITLGDQALANLLQRWSGYCATADVSEQAFVFAHGPGSNGKSLFLEFIDEILGELSGGVSSSVILPEKGRQSDRERLNVGLHNKRMVLVKDADYGVLGEGFIKSATGDEKLRVRYLYNESFDFTPTAKVIVTANTLPIIKDVGESIWRRVNVVPFNAIFGEQSKVDFGDATHLIDKRLREKLSAEHEGILRWIVDGAVMWYESGLQWPDIVRKATSEYRRSENKIIEFVTDCCEIDKFAQVNGKKLHICYRRWCESSGYHPLGKKIFNRDLLSTYKSITHKRGDYKDSSGKRTSGPVFKGIRIVNPHNYI